MISLNTQEILTQVDEVVAACEGERGALITVLQKVQEKLGYLPGEAITQVAYRLLLSPSEVYGVVTFYNFFRLKPTGANQVTVCRGTACHVRGGSNILDGVKRALGIQEDEITSDLKYSLNTVACVGACALAPVVVINSQVYGKMTTKKATVLLDSLPSHGALPPGVTVPGQAC